MNDAQRKQFFEIRRILDNLVGKLALVNEDAFNSMRRPSGYGRKMLIMCAAMCALILLMACRTGRCTITESAPDKHVSLVSHRRSGHTATALHPTQLGLSLPRDTTHIIKDITASKTMWFFCALLITQYTRPVCLQAHGTTFNNWSAPLWGALFVRKYISRGG